MEHARQYVGGIIAAAAEEARVDLSTAIKQVLRNRSGSEFQTTVQEIFRNRIKGFQAVEPYGKDGDGGNDGYSRPLGLYTQIYAPLSPKASTREPARKAAKDFAKLRIEWPKISRLKSYWFVMNATASNIHLERALALIEKKHGVKARFIGASELADEAMKMNRSRLEELMGFKVRAKDDADTSAATIDMLSNVDPQFLDALHLLAAIDYPVVTNLCEDLLPSAVDWKAFWKWGEGRRWIENDGDRLVLTENITTTCHKNEIAQKRACEAWVPALLGHGSIDCLYLSIRPLVMLARLKDAVRVVTEAGTKLAGSAWDKSMRIVWEIFNKPKVLRMISETERFAFAVAGANLLTSTGNDREAFKSLEKLFKRKTAWPRQLDRPLMMLNFGVAAHRSGHFERAAELYAEAAMRARRRGDDWVFGRATSNLAQTFIGTDPDKALALLDQSEAAKRRVKDQTGLAIVLMTRGLVAAEHAGPREALGHFKQAMRLLAEPKDQELRADLAFSLGKAHGELEEWEDAVANYQISQKESETNADSFRALRANVGLVQAYFYLEDWQNCRKQSLPLAAMPEETPHTEFRLTGLHALLVLALLGRHSGDVDELFRKAIAYARHTAQETWVSRILLDRQFAVPRDSNSMESLTALLERVMDFSAFWR